MAVHGKIQSNKWNFVKLNSVHNHKLLSHYEDDMTKMQPLQLYNAAN